MAARVTVAFNRLPQIAASLEPDAERVAAETAGELLGNIKRRVNVEARDTGAYHDAWRLEGTDVVNDAPHAEFVEGGTRTMPARPIARQEAEAIAPTYAERMRGIVAG